MEKKKSGVFKNGPSCNVRPLSVFLALIVTLIQFVE